MIKTSLRIFIYIVIAGIIWLGVQWHIAIDLKKHMYIAPEKALFVDQTVDTDAYRESLYDTRFSAVQKFLLRTFSPITQAHNGTPLFPFLTIHDALDAIDATGIRTVAIKNGTYEETLTLPENTILVGSGHTIIHSNPHTLQSTLTTSNGAYVANIHITGGQYAVLIPHGTAATFDRVTFADAGRFGVKMASKKRSKTPDGEKEPVIYEYYKKTADDIARMPRVQFINCTITNNDNQGMYLRDGRVEIHNSRITHNGEEGIDLHPHMHVTITNTDASYNGESGLESEIYDNIIHISQSTFTHNIKNGIGLITSHGVGDVTIDNTTITDNARYGTRCAVHKNKPKKPRPFFQSVMHETNNHYAKNAEGNYSTHCMKF